MSTAAAKARFSEAVRLAAKGTPVVVTKSGHDAVVMVDVATWKRWDVGEQLAGAIDEMWGRAQGDRVRAAMARQRRRPRS
jgi:prevent-host-death family protein